MKRYCRVILGQKHYYAEHCFNKGVIAVGFIFNHDMKNELVDDWREFNRKHIPEWLEKHPGKSKIAAGLSCGHLWTVSKGIKKGDVVLCPDGNGIFKVGEVISDYQYCQEDKLPHQRAVKWFDKVIDKMEMSDTLRRSAQSIGTVSDVSKHGAEIEKLIGCKTTATVISTNDNSIEDPTLFALEKHLEDFLVTNWQHTEIGKDFDIFEEDGELVGQQYQTDTGPIDILAISKDKKQLLVVELKKGRASDSVIGQVQRYMGYVVEDLAEPGQIVKGVIIALEDDKRIRRALAIAKNIEFYKYQINFKLSKLL